MASIDDIVKTRFADDRHRFMVNLIYTANWLQGTYREFLEPFGISPQQFNILRILRGSGEWRTMNDIKSLMIEKAPNATRLSDKLLNKGLIERKRSEEDRRVVYLNITSKGLKLLERIDENGSKVHEDFIEGLSVEDANYVSDLLDRLRG